MHAVAGNNELRIRGTDNHRSGEIETYNDHRMAMSFTMAGLRIPGIVILDPGVVNKSFPDFYNHWDQLYS